MTVTQDAASGLTKATYDPTFNLPVVQIDPMNRTTLLSYDGKGDLTRIQAPASNVTQMQYNSIGHVTQDLDPLSHATNYTYDGSDVTPLFRPVLTVSPTR